MEREVEFKLSSLSTIRIALRNPDLTTSRRIAIAVNELIGLPTAEPLDPATVASHFQSSLTATSLISSPTSSS